MSHRDSCAKCEHEAALRDRVRVLTELLREERDKFVLEDGACPECGALASSLGLDCETCEHVRAIDRALATTQEPPAKGEP